MATVTDPDALFPLRDARLHQPYTLNTQMPTIYKHTSGRGAKAIDGRFVHLKVRKWPSGLHTCQRWLAEFVEALNTRADADTSTRATIGTQSHTSREHDIAAAESEFQSAVGSR